MARNDKLDAAFSGHMLLCIDQILAGHGSMIHDLLRDLLLVTVDRERDCNRDLPRLLRQPGPIGVY